MTLIICVEERQHRRVPKQLNTETQQDGKRNSIKTRDKYLCQVCLTDEYPTNYRYTYKELEVHHIVPIEEDYELRLDSMYH